jgi:hypothetical protein
MLIDPQSPEEWQTAVNLSAFVLTLDSLRQYGLIETTAEYDVDRAQALLKAGAALGYVPPDDAAPIPVTYEPRRRRGRPRKG